MEEKVIIKSEKYNLKKTILIFFLIGVILALILASSTIFSHGRAFRERKDSHEHTIYCLVKEEFHKYLESGDRIDIVGYDENSNIEDYNLFCEYAEYSNGISYTIANYPDECIIAPLSIVVLFALIGGLIYIWLRSYELTVTDKRVFGKVAWGKRVDLPLDSISSTATVSLFKGIAVATSSGRIKFLMVKNSAEIFEKVNALLVERQKKKAEGTPAQASPAVSSADELKKYKELLDGGVITQEEFDAKKKEPLGL